MLLMLLLLLQKGSLKREPEPDVGNITIPMPIQFDVMPEGSRSNGMVRAGVAQPFGLGGLIGTSAAGVRPGEGDALMSQLLQIVNKLKEHDDAAMFLLPVDRSMLRCVVD